VRETKLILVEGLPGSGKSTLAQYLVECARAESIDIRWCYEEEVDHPVFIFHDLDSLRSTVDALNQGDHATVIVAALEQWGRFAAAVASANTTLLIDSCLFGYLTWSLFPLDVPLGEIESYVAEVARIIAPLQPCLVYLYQEDVAASLRRICARRGDATERWLMEQSTQSPYGRSHQLSGIDGMVAYWSAYRRLTDSLYDRLDHPKVAIETTAGEWHAYQQEALAFLGLTPTDRPCLSSELLSRFTGVYDSVGDGETQTITISLMDTNLIVQGMPQIWRDTPLRPIDDHRFAIESLPFEVRFERDGDERVHLLVSGPNLIDGAIPRLYTRRLG
jgi:thymidylate kinase